MGTPPELSQEAWDPKEQSKASAAKKLRQAAGQTCKQKVMVQSTKLHSFIQLTHLTTGLRAGTVTGTVSKDRPSLRGPCIPVTRMDTSQNKYEQTI